MEMFLQPLAANAARGTPIHIFSFKFGAVFFNAKQLKQQVTFPRSRELTEPLLPQDLLLLHQTTQRCS